jgi:hypothetical protein
VVITHGHGMRRAESARRIAVGTPLTSCGRRLRRAKLVRRGAVGIVAAIALLALVAGSALASSAKEDDAVTAIARSGHTLPENPMLHGGDRVVVTATGFASGADVTVGLVGVRLFGHIPADRRGRVVYAYTIPTSIGSGQHSLIFSGLAMSTSGGNLSSAPSSATKAPAPFIVTVPLTEQWKFRTAGKPSQLPSLGVSGTGAHRGHDHGRGPTAFTGFDALGVVIVGLAAVAGGVGLVRAGSRRRRGIGSRTH